MKIQKNVKTGALYIYLGKADSTELGWTAGAQIKACVVNNKLILQKRGIFNEV
jgi:hypothetical protein